MVPDKSLGKFWPDLEISEAYLMGLVVSSSGDFVSWNLKEKNRVSQPQSPKSIIL